MDDDTEDEYVPEPEAESPNASPDESGASATPSTTTQTSRGSLRRGRSSRRLSSVALSDLELQYDSNVTAAPSFITDASKVERKRPRSRSTSRARSSSVASDTSRSTAARITTRGIPSLKRQLADNPTIYDLAAGKVRQPSRHASFVGIPITKPYPPVEFYFDKKRVKTGDEDEDNRLYWRREVDNHKLPSSELLWAVHRHASARAEEAGSKNLRFMDESALLAIGVLLEETMKQSLGKNGHLAFLESEATTATGQQANTKSDERAEEDTTSGEDHSEGESSDQAKDELFVSEGRNSRISKKALAKGYTQDDYLTD